MVLTAEISTRCYRYLFSGSHENGLILGLYHVCCPHLIPASGIDNNIAVILDHLIIETVMVGCNQQAIVLLQYLRTQGNRIEVKLIFSHGGMSAHGDQNNPRLHPDLEVIASVQPMAIHAYHQYSFCRRYREPVLCCS